MSIGVSDMDGPKKFSLFELEFVIMVKEECLLKFGEHW